MDDGNISPDGEIHPNQIRIQTGSGASVILDGTNDTLYMVNSTGSGWVEIGAQGEIMAYAQGSFSVRAEGDINLRADQNINMEAGERVTLRVGTTLQLIAGIKRTLKVKVHSSTTVADQIIQKLQQICMFLPEVIYI
jgi:hypothetical protein